jgi:hypothetical protein
VTINKLLTLSARVKGDASFYRALAQQINTVSWAEVPALAEAQGLGPLLYWNLKNAGVSLPVAAKRALQALYLRHQHANRVRGRALAQILAAFASAGIPARVLKGAALAWLVYPEPGLRAMRDLDILVPAAQARQAQQVLAQLGFNAPLPGPADPLPDKHLALAGRSEEGLQVSVELHHNLFHTFEPASMTMADLTGPPLAFDVNGVTAYALGPEDMLWHLSRHIAYHASIWEPIRLVWAADLVGFANRYAAQTDWAKVARLYPLALNLLSLFHFVSPLSHELRQLAPLEIGPQSAGVGQEFNGWPRHPWQRLRANGQSWPQIIRRTFAPSDWWLRLHYGLNSAQPLGWYRWFRHPLYILGPFYLAEKARLWRARANWQTANRK